MLGNPLHLQPCWVLCWEFEECCVLLGAQKGMRSVAQGTECRFLLARHLLPARGCNSDPRALRRSWAPLPHGATQEARSLCPERAVPLSPEPHPCKPAVLWVPAGGRCCTAGREQHCQWSNTDMQRSAAASLPACPAHPSSASPGMAPGQASHCFPKI